MPLDAQALGLERTIEALRQLLADHFGVAACGDASLFSVGLGLSSLDGIEFLCEVERKFDVHVDDLEWWVYETPTLENVARHVIELTRRQHPLGVKRAH